MQPTNIDSIIFYAPATVTPPSGAGCGTQVFALTNLNVGTQISQATAQTNNGITEKWCYNNVATSSNTPAWDGTNTTGFNALPAGKSFTAVSSSMYSITYMWSSTESIATDAWIRLLSMGNAQSRQTTSDKLYGLSVRCIQY